MHSWIWLALGSAFFAALVAIFGKIGLEKIDPTLATTLRSGFVFSTLLLVTLLTGKFSQIGSVHGKHLTFIVLAGIAGGISWICYFWALKYGKASQVASIDRLSLVFVIAFAALFLGDKIGMRTGIGALFMTVGAILIALG